MRPGSEFSVDIEAVPGAGTQPTSDSEEHRLLAYRVHLEIAGDAVLPAYVPDEPSQAIGQ